MTRGQTLDTPRLTRSGSLKKGSVLVKRFKALKGDETIFALLPAARTCCGKILFMAENLMFDCRDGLLLWCARMVQAPGIQCSCSPIHLRLWRLGCSPAVY